MTTLYDVVVKIAMWKVEILQLWSLNLQLLLHYQRLNPVHILMCTYRMVWCANIRFAKIQMTKESFALESYVTLNHVAARFLHLMKLKMGCKFRSVSQKFISTFKSQAQCIDWRWNRDYAINYDGISTCT